MFSLCTQKPDKSRMCCYRSRANSKAATVYDRRAATRDGVCKPDPENRHSRNSFSKFDTKSNEPLLFLFSLLLLLFVCLFCFCFPAGQNPFQKASSKAMSLHHHLLECEDYGGNFRFDESVSTCIPPPTHPPTYPPPPPLPPLPLFFFSIFCSHQLERIRSTLFRPKISQQLGSSAR